MAFHAPPGTLQLRVTVEDTERYCTVEHPGGPGLADLDGLPAAAAVTVEARHGIERRQVTGRTLPSPPGPELARVATISDLHIGSLLHGLANTMFDRSGYADPPPVRCARGALQDAVVWGAELVVGKGDLTQHGWAEEWGVLGALVDRHAAGIARLAVPGNHDTPSVRDVAAPDGLAAAGFGHRGVEWADLSGVRVIAADSTLDSTGYGSLRRHGDEVVQLAADARRDGLATLVCVHHPIERAPVQLQYPKGVPFAEGRRFARRLADANPNTILSAGHTHRNRRRRVEGLEHTEVGSTKDWPGVWGGYVFHEGGVRQVVRRISAPDAIGWIDYSRWAAGGLWHWYSPGRLPDRCFTLCW